MVPENTRKYAKNLQNDHNLRQINRLGSYPTREVPVDVHVQPEQHIARTLVTNIQPSPNSYQMQHHHSQIAHQSIYNHTSHIRVPSNGLPFLDQSQPQLQQLRHHHQHYQQQQQQHQQHQQWTNEPANIQRSENCWRCGLSGPCACMRADRSQLQPSNLNHFPQIIHDNQVEKSSVRLARNRKVNASFRAAIDGFDDDPNPPVSSARQPETIDTYQPIIIEVDRCGSNVLGITVEASQSLSSNWRTKIQPHGLEHQTHTIPVYPSMNDKVPCGLQITHIQEGNVVHKNGNFRIGDIIVEVNGVNLQTRTFKEAQHILRKIVHSSSSQDVLLLRILRKNSKLYKPSDNPPPTPKIMINQNHKKLSPKPTQTKIPYNNGSSTGSGARHLAETLNTRKIGQKHRIQLRKCKNGGFGIKIAERDNALGTKRPIYVIAITTTGAAYKDGRLKEGDMLLEVNGVDLTNKSQAEVTKMLKGVEVDGLVEFVVSRQELTNGHSFVDDNDSPIEAYANDCDNERSLIDFESPNRCDKELLEQNDEQSEIKNQTKSKPGIYVYDIPINDTKSAGLGLYLKYPSLNRKDLGIWIEKVITGGAAWKDGRLQPDDQILAINGINLMGLSNAEASETLTAAVCKGIGPEATSNIIRLNVHRRDPSIVAKILRGTNNRIEHSDLPPNENNRSCIDITSAIDNFKTGYQNSLHSRSQSSTETSSSNRSANYNSHNSDLALSPQTQDSLKLTSSNNDRSTSSDRTNTSAISQITDYTNIPVENSSEVDRTHEQVESTKPKTIDHDEVELTRHETRSWDEESIDIKSGEERFQRDGFGRQSISEKRHAQLNAKNTDTYKRNRKLREERERQRLEDLQLEPKRHESARPKSCNLETYLRHQEPCSDVNGKSQLYSQINQLRDDYNLNLRDSTLSYPTREVPVDVHIQPEPNIARRPATNSNNYQHQLAHQPIYNHTSHIRVPSNGLPYLDQPQLQQQNQWVDESVATMQRPERCWRCGLLAPCACMRADHAHMHTLQANLAQSAPIGDYQLAKNAVRLARNRKVNASFRAAVERCYDSKTEQPIVDDRNNYRTNQAGSYLLDTNHVQQITPSSHNLIQTGVRDELTPYSFALEQQRQQRASDHRNLYYWGP